MDDPSTEDCGCLRGRNRIQVRLLPSLAVAVPPFDLGHARPLDGRSWRVRAMTEFVQDDCRPGGDRRDVPGSQWTSDCVRLFLPLSVGVALVSRSHPTCIGILVSGYEH